MIVVTRNEDNVIIALGSYAKEVGNDCFEVTDINTVFPYLMCNYFKTADNLPASKNELISGLYCYTEQDGFYLTPDQPDPNYGVDPATVEQIQADYREKLAKEVANYGYNA